MVLGRGPDEGHATDIDVFDRIRIANIWFGNRFFKRIQIHGDQVNLIPAQMKELVMVFLCGARKESTVNRRVQGFHASAQDFG